MLKTQIFEKKGNLPSEKFKLTDFSRIIKHDKCQGRYYKGPQCILPNIVQMIGPFFWDLSGRLKKKIFHNIAVFTVTKVFGQCFLVSSSVTELKKQYISVYNIC